MMDYNPRKRLVELGPAGTSTAELLALLLGTGVAGERVHELAQRLLGEYGSLDALLESDLVRLLGTKGIGPAKASRLKAAHELSIRYTEAVMRQPPRLNHAQLAARYVQKRIGGLSREVFGCLFLDSRHHLIAWEALFFGSIDRAHVHPREILKRGLELNAAAVICAHNHPSGVAEPSQADIQLTASLADLLWQVEIRLLDHIVVARHATVSLADRGLIVPR